MIDEEKLIAKALKEIPFEKSFMITSLPEVDYKPIKKIKKKLDIRKITGKDFGLRFIDIDSYAKIFGLKKIPDAVMVNVLKTKITDPKNIYIAVKKEVNESTVIHEIAHALDYIAGSQLLPALAQALSFEFSIPVEHLEHTHEFGYWFDYLRKRLHVKPDPEDYIICVLYEKGLLIKGEEIRKRDGSLLRKKSEAIIRFLLENYNSLLSRIRSK